MRKAHRQPWSGHSTYHQLNSRNMRPKLPLFHQIQFSWDACDLTIVRIFPPWPLKENSTESISEFIKWSPKPRTFRLYKFFWRSGESTSPGSKGLPKSRMMISNSPFEARYEHSIFPRFSPPYAWSIMFDAASSTASWTSYTAFSFSPACSAPDL